MSKIQKSVFLTLILLISLISCAPSTGGHSDSASTGGNGRLDEKFTIMYMSDYSTPPVSKKVASGYVLAKEDLPVLKDNVHIFSGWYIGESIINEGKAVTSDIVLVGKWTNPIGNSLTPQSVGDIIFNDGSSYHEPKYNSLTAEMKSKAVGVVAAIVKDDFNKDVYLLAALNCYTDTAWAKEGAGCYDTTPNELTPENDSYGPNNWNKICNADSVYTAADKWEEYYPAFYKCMTHGNTKGYTGQFAEGWYLPSIGELKTMYNNYSTYASSISYAGGSAPAVSSYSINDKNEKIYYYKYLLSSNGIDNTAYLANAGSNTVSSNTVKKLAKSYVKSQGTIDKTNTIVLPVYRYSVE